MKHYPTEKRNQEMELAREDGETYAAIGKRCGITKNRVAEIRREMMEAGTWPRRQFRPNPPILGDGAMKHG